jgi:hypothetical protein
MRTVAVTVALLCATAAYAVTPGFGGDAQQAVDQAQKEGKLIFVYFHMDG